MENKCNETKKDIEVNLRERYNKLTSEEIKNLHKAYGEFGTID